MNQQDRGGWWLLVVILAALLWTVVAAGCTAVACWWLLTMSPSAAWCVCVSRVPRAGVALAVAGLSRCAPRLDRATPWRG